MCFMMDRQNRCARCVLFNATVQDLAQTRSMRRCGVPQSRDQLRQIFMTFSSNPLFKTAMLSHNIFASMASKAIADFLLLGGVLHNRHTSSQTEIVRDCINMCQHHETLSINAYEHIDGQSPARNLKQRTWPYKHLFPKTC